MRSYEKTYITPVDIGVIEQSDGFFDDEAGQFKKEGELLADVQPYNGGLAEKEYGQVGEVSLRMFCPLLRELLQIGKVAMIADEFYTITYAEHWERGSVALLKKRL